MLDLRVVLAACLAAFVFLLAGIGVFATLRIGRESSVAVVKEGGLPPVPVPARVVPRDPRAPVPVPANQVRAEEQVPPPAPETTGSIENMLQPPLPAPVLIEDLLKSLPLVPEPPPVVSRVEPAEPPAVAETMPNRAIAAPLPPGKPAAQQVRLVPNAYAKKPRARIAHRARPAANPATAAAPPPFNLFNTQPAASIR
ncbi:MAG: hypothetical protein ACXWVF_08090 [Telluria sp.]